MTGRVGRCLAALLGGAVLLLGGCTAPTTTSTVDPGTPAPVGPSPSPAGPGPAATPTATPSGAQAQGVLDRLFAAGRAGDRAAWDAGVVAPDAASAARAAMLFDNLRTVRPERLHVRLTGAAQQLPTARQAALGPDARVLQATLTWRLPGERADASSSVWLTLLPTDTGWRLAGTEDGTRLDAPALPLWWLSPVARATRGEVTVLAGPGQDAARWAGLAARAAADAREHLPSALRRGWDGHLVVQVPGSASDFASVLGAAPDAYATTAAVTRPEGPTTGAAVRVVVNPAVAGDPDAELGTVLTHETVHVATRSARSPAPLWAVEGLAEYVALEAHPDQRADELAALRPVGAGAGLPADARFTAGGQDVTAAYAEAWLACQAVAEHRGRTDLGRFYAALDDGRTVQQASRSALGVDRDTLTGWWRDAVRAAAGGQG